MIKKGSKVRSANTGDRSYAHDKLSQFALTVSGIKVRKKAFETLGGKEDSIHVWYGVDGDNKVFVYKTTSDDSLSSKVSSEYKSFTNKGLSLQMLALAGKISFEKAEDESIDYKTILEAKAQIVCEMSETPVTEDGVDYYELTFAEYKTPESANSTASNEDEGSTEEVAEEELEEEEL